MEDGARRIAFLSLATFCVVLIVISPVLGYLLSSYRRTSPQVALIMDAIVFALLAILLMLYIIDKRSAQRKARSIYFVE